MTKKLAVWDKQNLNNYEKKIGLLYEVEEQVHSRSKV